MSNYISKAKHPKTEKIEDAQFLDDFYGLHKYGVRFDDGNVYPVSEIDIPTCDCAEMSCKDDCSSNHTHKAFSCEKCQLAFRPLAH